MTGRNRSKRYDLGLLASSGSFAIFAAIRRGFFHGV
jgi:hypothetical protein